MTINYTAPLCTLKGLEKRDAAYRAALELVARIDEELTRGSRHYRTRAGVLLVKLDEVVRAIVEGDLSEPDEEGAGLWMPEGLAA